MARNLTLEQISEAVQNLIARYGETQPERLASAMGILVAYEPMGVFEGCCKGFFIIHRRMKHITVNSDLPQELQRVILAHELGHAVLHCGSATLANFHEFTLFDDTEAQEFEANIFAADLLMTDEQVLDVLNEDTFFFQAARILKVPSELLDFKFRLMKRRGYHLNSPITAPGDFMKKLERDLRDTSSENYSV